MPKARRVNGIEPPGGAAKPPGGEMAPGMAGLRHKRSEWSCRESNRRRCGEAARR